jgi:hypothetical protein
MPLRFIAAALVALFAASALAQTNIVVGVVADSSVGAPLFIWNRTDLYGNSLSAGLNGWTAFAEVGRAVAPGERLIASIGVTPLRAHSSTRMYVSGERAPELEFHDTSFQAMLGRVDLIGERWTSDVRGIVLYEHVTGLDAATSDSWSSPYAGVRTRQSYHHITAEDPLLLTFEGSEIAGQAEVFAGHHLWSRFEIDQRAGRRFGRFRAAESTIAFTGQSIDTVNAFLAGASWPIAGLQPLYGYRYAELRLDHGVGINVDAEYAFRNSTMVTAHAGALRSHGATPHGVAVDVAHSWRGIGFRIGVAQPLEHDRAKNRPVIYGSVLASSFIQ